MGIIDMRGTLRLKQGMVGMEIMQRIIMDQQK